MPRLMAATYDLLTRRVEAAGLSARRAALLAPLGGAVLEIGAGTGHNLAHYPPGVGRLVLTEPDRFMRARLETAAAALGRAVEVVDAPAERLPFPDASFDAVVATLVLCSVPDPAACLAEVRRVLRPGGQFLFIEHVAAEGRPGLARWQRRLEPVWKRLAGGCHTTRRTADAVSASGLTMATLEHGVMHKAPPIVTPIVIGAARN